MREEVGTQVKKDPRRESTGPSLFIGLLQEVQRDVQALKSRVAELETALAEERQARLLAEVGAPSASPPSGGASTAKRRPSTEAMSTKATKNFRAASTRPPPRLSTRPPPAKK